MMSKKVKVVDKVSTKSFVDITGQFMIVIDTTSEKALYIKKNKPFNHETYAFFHLIRTHIKKCWQIFENVSNGHLPLKHPFDTFSKISQIPPSALCGIKAVAKTSF